MLRQQAIRASDRAVRQGGALHHTCRLCSHLRVMQPLVPPVSRKRPSLETTRAFSFSLPSAVVTWRPLQVKRCRARSCQLCATSFPCWWARVSSWAAALAGRFSVRTCLQAGEMFHHIAKETGRQAMALAGGQVSSWAAALAGRCCVCTCRQAWGTRFIADPQGAPLTISKPKGNKAQGTAAEVQSLHGQMLAFCSLSACCAAAWRALSNVSRQGRDQPSKWMASCQGQCLTAALINPWQTGSGRWQQGSACMCVHADMHILSRTCCS